MQTQIVTNSPGTVITVQQDLSHIAQTTLQSTIDKAMNQTNWAWYDVMVGMREIGYQPNSDEEERIKRSLFKKKLKSLLEKEQGIRYEQS